MRFFTIHQRWLDFLNRHAVGAHLLLLPVSIVPWVIFMAIPSIHGGHNNLLNEFIYRYYFLLVFRLSLFKFLGALLYISWIAFIALPCSYFLLSHVFLYAYRKKKREACIAIPAAFILSIGCVYAHGLYCERSFRQVEQYSGNSMPYGELLWKCGAPLCYTVDQSFSFYAVYTDGGMDKEVRLTAPHLWATATVNTMGYLWLD